MATISGIDVSYWDSGIDWPKVRATGQRFVIAKATEGITYKDPTFDDNWIGAKSAGLYAERIIFFAVMWMQKNRQIILLITCVP